ncbi:hypothetical protein ACR76M_09745 [Enterococcus innesii]|uniref:hypothetical protein n=1 Tax=Enterococcus innesii TaxID=2839759 RepID=UPI003DA628A9
MSESIQEHLTKLDEVIRKEDFLLNRGLGNEVGYYIFDYDPEDELVVREHMEKISGTSIKHQLQSRTLKRETVRNPTVSLFS